ncbi:hypothetical protein B0J13DRAFT_675086, partial [Dactylonectria estremocensis]
MASAQDAGGSAGGNDEARGEAASTHPSCICTQCNRRFSRLAHLKRHQRSHRPDRPFSCSLCSVSSSRKDVILRHMRNFHPDKPTPPERNRSASYSSSSHSSSRQGLPSVQDSIQADKAQHQHDALDNTPGGRPSTEAYNYANLSDWSRSFADSLLPQENFSSSFQDLTLSNGSNFDHFEALQLTDQDFLSIFDSRLIMPGAGEVPTMMPDHDDHISTSPTGLSNTAKSSATGYVREEQRTFAITDNEYESVKMMAAFIEEIPGLCNFKIPSKFAISRFVSAFFEYAAPILPIIHAPTFSIACMPLPLLIEIMAHGALYSHEKDTAKDMHMVASYLIKKNNHFAQSRDSHNEFRPWTLQISLLICHFGAFSGNPENEVKLNENFSYLMSLVDQALKEVKTLQAATYLEWVEQETLNRQVCIAASILLSAAFFSHTTDQRLSPATLEPKFLLPSPTASWLQDESHWERPDKVACSSDALSMIFEGRKFPLYNSDFAFATIASGVLCHVCLFESICKARHPELFAGFAQKMDRSVRLLGEIWKEQLTGQLLIESTMSPMAHFTRSIMISLSFHLFASNQLMAMKRLLYPPELLDCYESIEDRFDDRRSATLEGALFMAAEMLRSDCRTGLGYIKTCGYLRFGPMAGIAAYEASLLLCWYLQTNKSKLNPESAMDRLIVEAMSETEGQWKNAPVCLPAFPLMVYAHLFDDALWQFLPTISQRLRE